MSAHIEYVPFSDTYKCLPKIVGVLDTGDRRILAGSKEWLKELVVEHVKADDSEQRQNLFENIESSCPLPSTTEELPHDHRALIHALNGSPPHMWTAVIGMWIDPEKRIKSQH